MIAEGAHVSASGADLFEQFMDLLADQRTGAGRDDVELVHASNQRDPAGDLAGEIPRFLVTPDADRRTSVRDNMLLNAKRSAACMVGHAESHAVQGIVDPAVVWKTELSVQRG